MNIKDMYSVFEHDEQFAIRMLVFNAETSSTFPGWSYLYLADSAIWADKWSFKYRYGYVQKLKYFSTKEEAQEYIDNYIKDNECF